jgi:hypothetical protein
MACIMEPKVGPTGEHLKWEPMNIPAAKPFVNISTSPEEALSTDETSMNFVKTRSLVYSAFHSTARYVNFEVGYSKDAKWLGSIDDKWNDFSNFFVGGFLEAIYSINDKTYIQIDAKLIDYDTRFRSSNNHQYNQPASPKSANAFASRRNQLVPAASRTDSVTTNETQTNKLKTIPNISRNSSMIIDDDTQDKFVLSNISRNNSMIIDDDRQDNNASPIIINDDESSSQPIADDEELTKFMSLYKKFKDIQTQDQSSTPISTDSQTITSPSRSKKPKLSDLCNLDLDNDSSNPASDPASNNDPYDDPATPEPTHVRKRRGVKGALGSDSTTNNDPTTSNDHDDDSLTPGRTNVGKRKSVKRGKGQKK